MVPFLFQNIVMKKVVCMIGDCFCFKLLRFHY